MNNFKQVIELLKTQYSLKYRFFLGLGVLSYILILFLGLNVEIIWSILKYFGISQESCVSINPNVKIRDYVVIIGIMVMMFINIYLGTFFIISDYIGKKRDFFLLPYNIMAKFISVFIYGFSWIFMNIVVSISAFYLVVLGIKDLDLRLFYGLNTQTGFITVSIVGLLLFIAQILGFILIYTLIRTEKSRLKNLCIFCGLILVFALFDRFVTNWLIIDGILKSVWDNTSQDFVVTAVKEDYIPSVFSLTILGTILFYISKYMGIDE